MDKFIIPKEGLISPSRIKEKEAIERLQKVKEEEEKRFQNIARKVITILIEEKVKVSELPRVNNTVAQLLNVKIDNAELDKILALN